MRRRARNTWDELRVFPRIGVVALGLTLVALAFLFVLKWAPEWLAAEDGLSRKDRVADVGRTRTAILAMLAGVLAAIGAYYTHRTFQLNRQAYEHTREMATRSHELDRAGQITERFTRAIDQLGATDDAGEPKIDVVLGGIYALERIARDSKDDHPQVVEVLTAYVREHALYQPDNPTAAATSSERGQGDEPASPDGAASPDAPQLATDVQAAMDVLARRDVPRDRRNHRLNLARTDLASLVLDAAEGGHLEGADLVYAHLEGATLRGAHLEGALLGGAHLERAELYDALYDDWTQWPTPEFESEARARGARHVDEAK